nr:unnamed protein product [Naegleria fowleri]
MSSSLNKKSMKRIRRNMHPKDTQSSPPLREEPDQVYGTVVNVINPISVMECVYHKDYGTNETLRCVFRGNGRKPIYFQVGEVLLLHLREGMHNSFECADVLHRYKKEELEILKQRKQFPNYLHYDSKFHRALFSQLEKKDFTFMDLTFQVAKKMTVNSTI